MNVVIMTGKIVRVGSMKSTRTGNVFCSCDIEVLDARVQNLFLSCHVYGKGLVYKLLNLGKPGSAVTIRGAFRVARGGNKLGSLNRDDLFVEVEEMMFGDPVTDNENMKKAIAKYNAEKNKQEEIVDKKTVLSDEVLEII